MPPDDQRRIAAAYDGRAAEYAELFHTDLVDRVADLALTDRYVEIAGRHADRVTLDAGCGPAPVVAYLATRGRAAVGVDLSAELLREARTRRGAVPVVRGDTRSLPIPDGCLAGVVSRYGTIHIPTADWPRTFAEFARVTVPGGGLLLHFQATLVAEDHGVEHDHAVTTAFLAHPATLAETVAAAGYTVDIVEERPAADGERVAQGAILATRR